MTEETLQALENEIAGLKDRVYELESNLHGLENDYNDRIYVLSERVRNLECQ